MNSAKEINSPLKRSGLFRYKWKLNYFEVYSPNDIHLSLEICHLERKQVELKMDWTYSYGNVTKTEDWENTQVETGFFYGISKNRDSIIKEMKTMGTDIFHVEAKITYPNIPEVLRSTIYHNLYITPDFRYYCTIPFISS